MKHIAWGIVAGGAVAAAFAGAATANATGETWTPSYDVDSAQLFVGPFSFNQAAWELPATFTNGSTTLTGTDYLMRSGGGFNDEFVTKDGAIFDQNQFFPGFTNLYYAPSATGTAIDALKTPFGTFNLGSAPSWAVPTFPTDTAASVGHNMVIEAAGGSRIADTLGLAGGIWAGGPTAQDPITAMQAPDSSLVWSVPATFTAGTGAEALTVTGTEYVATQSGGGFHDEFITKAGAIFDQNEWAPGVTNMYFDPVNGPAVDHLQTLFGTFDLSPIASWFAPADISDLTAASPVGDLTDAGLYSALDLLPGLTA